MFVHEANQSDLHLLRVGDLQPPNQPYTALEAFDMKAYWVVLILQHSKSILDHYIILNLDQFRHPLSNPRSKYG